MDQLPHLRLSGPDTEIRYKTTQSGGGSSSYPTKDRKTHGEFIQAQLNTAWEISDNEHAAVHAERHGVYLEFQSSVGFDLAVKSLESIRSGIRLCNVRTAPHSVPQTEGPPIEKVQTFATVYIPNDKRALFCKKVENYLNHEKDSKKSQKPSNSDLINGIDELRSALLVESFWTDSKPLIPEGDAEWCEVWLRDDPNDGSVVGRFNAILATQQINSKSQFIRFPERVVMLVQASKEDLENISRYSDDIAEFRRAKDTARDLLNQSPGEQAEWAGDLVDRLSTDANSAIAVCVLDTGVNNGHPLLAPILSSEDCQSVDPSWGNHDHKGHGTLMAGLAAYGDLQEKLSISDPVLLRHVLESVKILPPDGQNDPELWGDITGQAISLAEIQAPNRKRICCMAVTADDSRDRGLPSSWSGAVDQITSGTDGSERRLLIVSSGNITDFNQVANYPDFQLTDSVHDPSQSWNALTVGAFTRLTTISDPELNGYSSIAGEYQLSPYSTTSLIWDDGKWPIKPEVVFEGGNVAVDASGFPTECDDLSLVSTHYKPLERLFDAFRMTSAATAQAAEFAAQILIQYPDYWPETVRALMVHSARWPDELRNQFAVNQSKAEMKKVLRCCGYGIPNLGRALYCAENSLTLIVEAEIQPFEKDGPKYRTKDMHLYRLPWPQDILLELGETAVEMRITLSYFVEPGPGKIGWKDRYRYASHALRFDLNSPTETEDYFVQRINKEARDDENKKPDSSSPSNHWVLGAQTRDNGSIHSDIWKGTASELATSNLMAVFPKIGWWRERQHLGKYNDRTRYALIVSITTPEQEVDIYTPVAAQIATQVAIPIN
ncbi:MAG: hypothetical protein ACI856_000832 [Kiritimatiellia bacterium]|jgi:hypothetical protein